MNKATSAEPNLTPESTGFSLKTPKHDPLPYPDRLYLQGALGWLELGDCHEAKRELNGIIPARRAHPDVLALYWRICAKARQWEECLSVSQLLTEYFPEHPAGWIALARTLYCNKRLSEAYEIGAASVRKFPDHWPLHYDTARYALLLGRRTEAGLHLHLAMAAGDMASIKQRSLKDPILKSLWKVD